MSQLTIGNLTTITLSRESLFGRLADPADQEAWRLVYERYAPLVAALARRSGLGREQARDAQQETLAAFAEAIRAERVDAKSAGGNPRGYLFRIACNKIADLIRDNGRQPPQVVDESDRTAFLGRIPDGRRQPQDWEEDWNQRVKQECLREAQQHFRPETLRIYRMRIEEGRSSREVADLLGTNVNTVDQAVKRVRAFMTDVFPVVYARF